MPGFLAGPASSTFLAGAISAASGPQARHFAFRVTGREVVIAVLFVVAVVVLLTIPVVWGIVAEATSGAAEKAAPATFFVGLGVLCTGLVAGAEIVAIIGGALVGLVVVGFIIDNYLGMACRAGGSGPPGGTVTDLFSGRTAASAPAGSGDRDAERSQTRPPEQHLDVTGSLVGKPRGKPVACPGASCGRAGVAYASRLWKKIAPAATAMAA
jgi:hypothetical protein